ncbi:MAG: hypothetical protein ABH812_00115 [bacterium]
MAKGRILEDTFEKIAELGGSTAKHAAKQTAQTFSPLNIFDSILKPAKTIESEIKKAEVEKKPGGHTPVNVDGLKKKYEGDDKQKESALRQRLFIMVKEGEETELEKKRKEEQEKKRMELQEEQQKKEEERKQKEQDSGGLPQGKVRRSIFSPKKKAQMQHTETKPAVGKS